MAAGWFPDPATRHEYRYWDGTSWTEHVSDRGVVGLDPLGPRPGTGTPTMQQLSAWSDEQMRAAAAWWRHRRSGAQPDADPQLPPVGLPFAGPATNTPVLDDTDEPTILGPWSGLAGAVGHYAIATSGVAGGGELLGVLHAITGSSDAQTRLLRRIDTKVDALVLGPYQTGRMHLSEAARLGGEDPMQRDHLDEAKDCFYSAQGQAVSVQSRALVEYHLAMTWLLLGRRDDALHWFAQSYNSAVTVVHELARQTSDVRVLHSRKGAAAATYLYPAGIVVLGMKFKKMLAAEQAKDMMREFLPFLACVAHSHNSLAEPEAHVPALQLTATPTGQDLVETDV
jgi:hypothetical protein